MQKSNRANMDDRFGAWAKELNLKITTLHIMEAMDEYRVLSKVIPNLFSRVKTKKRAQKYVNYCDFVKLSIERDENTCNFQKLNKLIPDLSSIDYTRKLEMTHKLFFLVTGSEIYKRLQECEQAETESVLTEKIVALMQATKKYCDNIDSVEHLIESDADFNEYYFKMTADMDDIEDRSSSLSTFEEITQQIQTTMQQISSSLDRILQFNCKSLADQSTLPMNFLSTSKPSASTIDISALQSMLNKWLSLYVNKDC